MFWACFVGKPSQRTLLLWETRNCLSCTGESTYMTRGGQGVEALSGISPSSPWRQGRTPRDSRAHVAGYVSLGLSLVLETRSQDGYRKRKEWPYPLKLPRWGASFKSNKVTWYLTHGDSNIAPNIIRTPSSIWTMEGVFHHTLMASHIKGR